MTVTKKTTKPVTVTMFTAEQIDKQIALVVTNAMSLQVKIHSIAVSILKIWHDAKEDEDAAKLACERLNALQSASPYHAKAFAKWVQMFTNLHWAEETKVWFLNVAEENRVWGKVFVVARDTPFWKVSPPADPKPMMLEELLTKLVTQVEKRLDNPVEGDVVNKAALKYLREAVKASSVTAPVVEPDF
jgi:hypothetical protein